MRKIVTRYGSHGTPHVSFEEVDRLPRIPDEFLRSVFWCYGSLDCAKRREACGGTGFLVSLPAEEFPGLRHVFGITNHHVVKTHCHNRNDPCNGAQTITLNHPDYAFEPERFEKPLETDWEPHRGGADLAACYFGLHPGADSRFTAIRIEDFLKKGDFNVLEVGPGDGAFMIGRYVNHDGTTTNAPSARFGQISMNPGDKIKTSEGDQVGFIVELISQGGFSGSPVFLSIPGNTVRATSTQKPITQMPAFSWFLKLVGVDFGHLKLELPVVRNTRGERIGSVEWPTGANLVIPSWTVEELLRQAKPTKWMRQAEAKEKDEIGAIAHGLTPAKPAPPTIPDGDEKSRERFMALQDAVLGKPKRGD